MLDLPPDPAFVRGCSVLGLTSRCDTAAATPAVRLPLRRTGMTAPLRFGVGADRTAWLPLSAAPAAWLSSGVTSGFSALLKLLAAFAAASSARRERSSFSGDGPPRGVVLRLRGVLWRLDAARKDGTLQLSDVAVRAVGIAVASVDSDGSDWMLSTAAVANGSARSGGAATSVVMKDETLDAAVSMRPDADDGGRGSVGMRALPAVLGGSCKQAEGRLIHGGIQLAGLACHVV